MTDAAGAQRVEEIRRAPIGAWNKSDLTRALRDVLARLRAVEDAGKVLVEANTRHFNAAREAEDKLRAVEAEKEVAVSEMIGLREVLRSVEGEHEQALKVVVEAKDMLAEQLRTAEGEHKAQLAALKVTFDSMHLACSNECARANAAEEEARRLEAEIETWKVSYYPLKNDLREAQQQLARADDETRRLREQSEQAAIAWALEIEVLKEENGRLRAQIASVWLRMKNLTVELEDLLDSTKGAS